VDAVEFVMGNYGIVFINALDSATIPNKVLGTSCNLVSTWCQKRAKYRRH
jgi:hypothetical protein